jgi:hypothetical protein
MAQAQGREKCLEGGRVRERRVGGGRRVQERGGVSEGSKNKKKINSTTDAWIPYFI